MIADYGRLFWLSWILVLVSACQSTPPYPSADLQFTVSGKLGYKSSGRGQSARFSWLQYSDGYEIEVWGPLGQGRVRLAGNFQRMAVYKGDEILDSGSVRQVMQRTLGWSVPIEVLRDWIKGRPNQEFPITNVVRAKNGNFEAFNQVNWAVKLSKYVSRAHDTAKSSGPKKWSTPGKIIATSVNSDVSHRVTVVILEFLPAPSLPG